MPKHYKKYSKTLKTSESPMDGDTHQGNTRAHGGMPKGGHGLSHIGPRTTHDGGGHGHQSYLTGVGGKDPHASPEFHENNKKHAMPHGLAPHGNYKMQDDNCGDEIGDNETHYGANEGHQADNYDY